MSEGAPHGEDDAALGPQEQAPLLWGLDPLLSANVKLLMGQVHVLGNVQLPGEQTTVASLGLLPPHGRPMRKVHVGGTVVLKIENRASQIIGIDDGTGLIYVTIWLKDAPLVIGKSANLLLLGVHVSVIGRLESEGPIQKMLGDSTGRKRTASDIRSIVASRVRVVFDPNDELVWWLEVLQAHSQCYEMPLKTNQAGNDGSNPLGRMT